MENKKMTIAIIILIILIIAIVGFNFAFSEFNNKQTNILTEETNKILQSDITKENIDFNIKTERNYAVVEKAIKEYISELKNIYKEISEIDENINPNNIKSNWWDYYWLQWQDSRNYRWARRFVKRRQN